MNKEPERPKKWWEFEKRNHNPPTPEDEAWWASLPTRLRNVLAFQNISRSEALERFEEDPLWPLTLRNIGKHSCLQLWKALDLDLTRKGPP